MHSSSKEHMEAVYKILKVLKKDTKERIAIRKK